MGHDSTHGSYNFEMREYTGYDYDAHHKTETGFEIAHYHQGQKIVFSAWKGGKPINQDEGFIFDRCYIGCHENIFYEDPLFLEQVDWLLREELETKN